MSLSTEQMLAVHAGSPTNESWEVVPLPEGPQTIPSWVLGMRVNWMHGYGNRPHIDLMTDGTEYNATDFPGWEYGTLGKTLYTTESSDGRLQWHSHEMYSEVSDLSRYNKDTQEWETYKGYATPQSRGYGGRAFNIVMKDGTPVILRGPWHTGAPAGFVEVATYDRSKVRDIDIRYALNFRKRLAKQDPKRFGLGHTPELNYADRMRERLIWRAMSGTFGLAVRDELFIRLFAHFQPHLRLARVRQYSWYNRIEPRYAGQPPKDMQLEGQDLDKD